MWTKCLDWLADLGIRMQVRIVLFGLVFLPAMAILIALEFGVREDVTAGLIMYLAVWVLLFIPVAKSAEAIMALHNITQCNNFCRSLQEGRGLGDLHLPPEKGGENDFIRLKRNMYWMGRSLLDREHRISGMLQELEGAQRQVMDSIDYASAIQHQMQLPPKQLSALLVDGYVLWKPRDVVGGDSYWLQRTPNGVFVGVFDCTGHGVPGAFITLIIHSMLDTMDMQAIEGRPGLVLAALNQRLKTFLGQDGSVDNGAARKRSNDGLEMGLCYIPDAGDALCYAGAGIGAFLNTAAGPMQLKAAKMGIGYRETPMDHTFQEQHQPLEGVTGVHLASDGLFEQPGGEKGLPFGKKRFHSLLLQMQTQSLASQGQTIWEHFESYCGLHTRRDDLTVMGFIPRTATVS